MSIVKSLLELFLPRDTLHISSSANSFVHGLTNDQKVSYVVKNCKYSCFKIQVFFSSSLCEDTVLFTSQDRINIIFQKTKNFLFAISGKINQDAVSFCQHSCAVDSSLFPQAPLKSRFRFFLRIPSKPRLSSLVSQGQGVNSVQNASAWSLATVIKFLNSTRRANFITQSRQPDLLHDTVPHVSAITVWPANPTTFCAISGLHHLTRKVRERLRLFLSYPSFSL